MQAQRRAAAVPEAPVLRIRLLGGFDVRYGPDRVPGLESPRLQALLAYLAVHRDSAQSRERLAFLMWPDSAESQARTNLRQLVHHLRRAVPDAESYVEVTSRTIQLRLRESLWCDVVAFEDAAERADDLDPPAEALVEAAELYGGDLLPSCYDDWLLDERARLHERYVTVLDLLLGRFEDERDYRAGIRYAERLLRQDPVHESTYRRLMRFHSLLDERARALRVYHTCVNVLDRELGVEPDPATTAVYEALVSAPESVRDERRPAVSRARVALVGRREEWAAAQRAWQDASAGQCGMLAVTGEAGVGKSRLVEELADWCAQHGVVTARTRAYAAEGQLAYAPVVEWLRAEALRPGLSALDDVSRAELARLLPEFTVPQPQLEQPEPLSEGERRRRLFEALARAVVAVDRPLLLVVDDLQWCDQETLEFLHYLVRIRADARLLVAGTARDEEITAGHPLTAVLTGLSDIDRLRRIALGPLAEEDATALAIQLSRQSLTGDVARQLYQETEGNPLFLVETVRARQQTNEASSVGTLPPRVRSVIQSRLAQLSPTASDVVGLAATIGREFTHDVLTACGTLDEDELVQGLDELWWRRIIREHPGGGYDFSHDKIREIAYASLGPARRRQLHLEIAGALASVHTGDPAGAEGQVASHYDRAGVPDQAIGHYRRAAEAAQRVWASEEVISVLGRACELLRTLPETRERDADELAMLIDTSVALVARRGHGSPEASEVYRRAIKLCERLGRPPDPPLLRGLALCALQRRDFDEAYSLATDLLQRGMTEDRPVVAVEGHYMLGVTTYWRGELTAATQHLESAIAEYVASDRQEHLAQFAQDPRAVCLSRLALAQWHRGRPDTAVRTCDEALASARELAHPWTLAYVLVFAVWLHGELGDLGTMSQLLTEARAATSEQEQAELNLLVRAFSGWLETHHGSAGTGIARIREGLAGLRQQQRGALETYSLTLLARAYRLAGDEPQAEDTVRHALEVTQHSGQRYLESELLRMSGELLASRDRARAESVIRQALDVARKQQARAFELRAAISLARLVREPGVLDAVYARFDEGYDTSDIRDARALQDELTA